MKRKQERTNERKKQTNRTQAKERRGIDTRTEELERKLTFDDQVEFDSITAVPMMDCMEWMDGVTVDRTLTSLSPSEFEVTHSVVPMMGVGVADW